MGLTYFFYNKKKLTRYGQERQIYEGKKNQDPASGAFEACSEAKEKNCDILLIDTAGRLSNNKDLMNQLSKNLNFEIFY